MTTAARGQRGNDARARGRRRRSALPVGWPLIAYFAGFPLWWVLGISGLALPIFALPMAVQLIRRGRITVPRGFGVWLLFLAWVLLGVGVLWASAPGAVEGGGSERLLPYGLRLSFYLGATIFLLYVGNLRERELSARRVVNLLAFYFLVATAGGLLGVLVPTLEFPSLLELVLPSSITSIPAIQDLVHPGVAQIQAVLGYEEARPKAPFAYTNEWGANMAILAPFFVLGWWTWGSRRQRLAAPFLLALAAIPLVLSLNRGAWLGIGLMAVYVAIRLLFAGRVWAVQALLAALVVGGVAFAATPLQEVVVARVESPHSNERRGDLVAETVRSAATGSPLVGFGSTRPVQGNFASIAGTGSSDCPSCAVPPFGTHGHMWLLIFAQGFIGAALFFGFVGVRLLRHARDRSPLAVTVVGVGLVFAFSSFFYNLLPSPLLVLLTGLGLAWRAGRERTASANTSRQPGAGRPLAATVPR